MPITLTVVLKDSERTYRHKFLIYSPLTMSPQDEIVRQCIKEAKESFGNEVDDITIKAQIEIQ